MDKRKEYNFEHIDQFEKDISRIIYYWRRFEGTKCVKHAEADKIFTKSEIADLRGRIDDYLCNPEKFDFDNGRIKDE